VTAAAGDKSSADEDEEEEEEDKEPEFTLGLVCNGISAFESCLL
jgi:hypothetical protein